ncbi:hypothetical protein EDWATA_01769 [Edwardsiella tarda ATCC 23685]|uniref:Uncharacterized protein n=1 Tax=Edwardsiella tarda ATCC 23685 TaxID=500638 RepID=D4F4U2_EDWTA|nr:hypothetical protein EDWATA_01769 [Edwardsiella tarda ATCC 23685]
MHATDSPQQSADCRRRPLSSAWQAAPFVSERQGGLKRVVRIGREGYQ